MQSSEGGHPQGATLRVSPPSDVWEQEKSEQVKARDDPNTHMSSLSPSPCESYESFL